MFKENAVHKSVSLCRRKRINQLVRSNAHTCVWMNEILDAFYALFNFHWCSTFYVGTESTQVNRERSQQYSGNTCALYGCHRWVQLFPSAVVIVIFYLGKIAFEHPEAHGMAYGMRGTFPMPLKFFGRLTPPSISSKGNQAAISVAMHSPIIQCNGFDRGRANNPHKWMPKVNCHTFATLSLVGATARTAECTI